MPDPGALKPLDVTSSSGTGADADAASRQDASPGDLAAVPSFLRGRPAAARDAQPRLPVRVPASPPEGPAIPDVASLPMLGIAPRRLILVGATVLLAWLIVSFGRQVAEASAASARADELRAANATLAAEVEAMERELQVIQDQRYISQAARAFRLGSPGEIPFALEADAPPLGADAPGSAATGLGAKTAAMSPLERWLAVLFGPGD
ncbi:MAG: hypothetical protein AB1736_00510 [Chloroflexota bacterium]